MGRCGDAEIGGNGDGKIENDGKMQYWGHLRKKEIRATDYPKKHWME